MRNDDDNHNHDGTEFRSTLHPLPLAGCTEILMSGGQTNISRAYLASVRRLLDPGAEGVYLPSGAPIVFIVRYVEEGILVVPLARRLVEGYRADGLQLDLLTWAPGRSSRRRRVPAARPRRRAWVRGSRRAR